MLKSILKARKVYFELILKIQSIICTIISILLVSIILVRKWIIVHGYITLVFSPIGYHYEYFGLTVKSTILESIRYLSLIPGFMIIVIGIMLVLAYVYDVSIDLTLGILYAYIVVFFVYSYIIVPHTWWRLLMVMASLGIRQEHVMVNVLAGVLELGRVDIYIWEPLQYGVNGFILCVLGSFYGIYKGMYE